MNDRKKIAVAIPIVDPKSVDEKLSYFCKFKGYFDVFVLLVNYDSELKFVDNPLVNKYIFKGMQVVLIEFSEALGSAGAFGYLIDYTRSEGFGWILTLDDDSEPNENGYFNKALSIIDSLKSDIAVVSSIQRSANGEDKCGWAKYNRFLGHNPIKPRSAIFEPIEIDMAPWAGMWINLELLEPDITPYRGYFFGADDYDFCLQIRRRGYKIIGTIELVISHNMVAKKSKWRTYYNVRNAVLFRKRNFPIFWQVVTILLSRNIWFHKQHLKFAYIGFRDGIKERVGRTQSF